MWRALFLAIAIAICILGLECMVIDRAVLNLPGRASSDYSLDPSDPLAARRLTRPNGRSRRRMAPLDAAVRRLRPDALLAHIAQGRLMLGG